MATLNQVSIPVAVNNKCKLDLSCDHVTTMNFASLQPVYYRHMMKGEHINFDCLATCRLAPMSVPTYGRMRLNLRGFAVPYRLAMPQWHNFYNDVIGSNYSGSSLVSGVPYFDSEDIAELFENIVLSVEVTDPTANYDLYMRGKKYNLTALGRRFYKVFRSLGYQVLCGEKGNPVQFNALALLCYAKIYLDWYANSMYLNSSDVLFLQRLLSYNDPSNPLHINATGLLLIVFFVDRIVYDDNGYFVNAWDNPLGASSGQFSSFTFADPTSSNGSFVTTLNTGIPEMQQNAATSTSLGTTYLHDALKKLTDYQRRHALAGARSIDRVLAQYGIQTDYLKTERSIYVGSQSIDLNVGDIYATANGSDGTTTSSVGDFAGRGAGQGSKSWDYTTDEECIFIVMASILPSSGYYQGYDLNNRHIDKHSFFQPEFDGLGVQAIEKGEVYVSPHDSFASNVSKYTGVFGFTGRYGEYKRPINFVTGDISLPRLMEGGDAWHLMREFNDGMFSDIDGVSHSLDFTRATDSDNYNRIFQYVGSDYDHFFCNFHFNVGSYAPCKPLLDSYDFESESKKITLKSNGATLN